MWHIHGLKYFIVAVLCVTCSVTCAGATSYEVGGEIGARLRLTGRSGEGRGEGVGGSGTGMNAGTVSRVSEDAANGNAQSQYFFGLLHLYGHVGHSPNATTASTWFLKAAKQGHEEAQLSLGIIFGKSTPQATTESISEAQQHQNENDDSMPRDSSSISNKAANDLSAVAWLQLAAEQGNAEAMWLLGKHFYDGRVANKEPVLSRARYWFSKGAQAGHTRCAFRLGVMYEYGLGGLPQDPSKSARLYEQAARNKDHEAEYYLALLLIGGRGVRRNSARGMELMRRSASGEHAPAMHVLGQMYASGQGGVPMDYYTAVAWLSRAIDSSNSHNHPSIVNEAMQLRDELQTVINKAAKQTIETSSMYVKRNAAVLPE